MGWRLTPSHVLAAVQSMVARRVKLKVGLQFLWPRPIGEGRTGMGWEWESGAGE